MNEASPRIIRTARKHGVSDDDMLHAFRNPVRVFDVEEDLTMFIGPSFSGQMLEVGVVDSEEGPVIIHAMVARKKFLEWGW